MRTTFPIEPSSTQTLRLKPALRQPPTPAGWTFHTSGNLMICSLIHNPYSTTLHTIYKGTGSVKWTAASALLPLVIGFVVTFLVATLWRMMV